MTLSFHGSKSRENKSLSLRLHLNQGIKNQLGLKAKKKSTCTEVVRKTSYTIATTHVTFHIDSNLIRAVQTVLISDKINQRILQISSEGYNDICHPYYMVFRESAVLFQITKKDRMCLRKNVL